MSIEFLTIEKASKGYALEQQKGVPLPRITGRTPSDVLDKLGNVFRQAMEEGREWPDAKTILNIRTPTGESIEFSAELRR